MATFLEPLEKEGQIGHLLKFDEDRSTRSNTF